MAGFAVLFATFDIAEVVHQLDNSRAGIATIAAALVLIHVAVALLSVQSRAPDALNEALSA